MNKRQLELLNKSGKMEAEIIVSIKRSYMSAMDDILKEVQYLESLDPTESILNRLKFQKSLEKQVGEIMHGMREYWNLDIDKYLRECYEDGFLGAMYDIHGQGIPLVFPINQNDVVNAILNDTKLSRPLYEALGLQVDELIEGVNKEIARGVAMSSSYIDIARNIRNNTRAPLARAMTIARTEGHRVRIQSTFDAQQKARDNGADIVKQWDSTADKKTRPTHRELDGQIQEIDNDFVVPSTGAKAPHPAGFGIAKEDINCRCALLQRARWALDDDELQVLKDKAEYWGFNEVQNFDKFKSTYLDAVDDMESLKAKIDAIKSTVSGGKPTEEQLKKAGKIFKDDYEKVLKNNPKYADLEFWKNETIRLRADWRNCESKLRTMPYRLSRFKEKNDDYYNLLDDYNRLLKKKGELFDSWEKANKEFTKLNDTIFSESALQLKLKLSEVRPMGSNGLDVTGHLNNSRSPMRKVVESAYDVYPRSWIEKSLARGNLSPKKVDRGYYSDWDRIIAISGDGTDRSFSTAVHELGHRFEQAVPNMLQFEKEFYNRRTAGEALQWLGGSYAKDEVTRFDQFIEGYMGKDYGGYAYELVSMGFQLAYTDPQRLLKDPDMAEWIFGLLTLVD